MEFEIRIESRIQVDCIGGVFDNLPNRKYRWANIVLVEYGFQIGYKVRILQDETLRGEIMPTERLEVECNAREFFLGINQWLFFRGDKRPRPHFFFCIASGCTADEIAECKR